MTKIGTFTLPVGLLLASLVAFAAFHFWIRQDLVPDAGGITERIQPVAFLELAPPPDAISERGKRTGVFLVHGSCRSCHSNGQSGAPQIGDRNAWTPRMNRGLDEMVRSVVSGKCNRAGGGSDGDERELARAVVYMIWPRLRL